MSKLKDKRVELLVLPQVSQLEKRQIWDQNADALISDSKSLRQTTVYVFEGYRVFPVNF
jgi:hypothetical protein